MYGVKDFEIISAKIKHFYSHPLKFRGKKTKTYHKLFLYPLN